MKNKSNLKLFFFYHLMIVFFPLTKETGLSKANKQKGEIRKNIHTDYKECINNLHKEIFDSVR